MTTRTPVRLPAPRQRAGPLARGAVTRRPRKLVPYLGALPFLCYVAVFLLWPTYIVVVGAFQDAGGRPSLENVTKIVADGEYVSAFARSIELSAATALAGALLGGLLAWAVAEGRPEGLLRRAVVAGSGVLAQFGGVMLAFAFLATMGFNGALTLFFQKQLGVDVLGGGAWLYGFAGLVVVYTYFQIPLMLIVFLPALDSLKPEWREASDSLGGSTWSYWRHVGGPVLAPAFTGAALLLFANAFSSFSTAAALVSQGNPIVPLQIRTYLTSEVALGQANLGKALALGMVVVVAVVMSLYALLQRRTTKWLR
ncbi:ABC transporter permease subunit [Streptomyces sp. HNM0575]|uniref:ABC transporter permease n=1 Tax=Streptomyces sp. HNM0575 TaxID=2716338 RepID=UPI00145FCE84|nr:ABC transporter permease subunit [Streptomyces sp. HNM0575]NLU74392.1 ABC transporter permease subunit [Streptomyces sp. HNM0575]